MIGALPFAQCMLGLALNETEHGSMENILNDGKVISNMHIYTQDCVEII